VQYLETVINQYEVWCTVDTVHVGNQVVCTNYLLGSATIWSGNFGTESPPPNQIGFGVPFNVTQGYTYLLYVTSFAQVHPYDAATVAFLNQNAPSFQSDGTSGSALQTQNAALDYANNGTANANKMIQNYNQGIL